MPIYDRSTGKAMKDAHSQNRFIQAGKNLEIVATRMRRNDDLCKLLVRNGTEALSDGKSLTDEERAKAFSEHISTVPVVDKEEDSKTRVILQIGDIVPMAQQGLMYNLVFDVICDVDNWELDGYTQRPYAIMNELDSVLSNTKMQTWGPVSFLGATSIKINERTLGYTMMFAFSEVQ